MRRRGPGPGGGANGGGADDGASGGGPSGSGGTGGGGRRGSRSAAAVPVPVVARPGQAAAGAGLLWPLAGLVAATALASVMHLWQGLWWLVLLIDFVLFVAVAEAFERRLPYAGRKTYQKVLAWLFPLLILATWEALSRGGILNPRWFPPPTRIARALWDLSVHYDRFNKSSLLGRPWLIPTRLVHQGWPGVAALFAESHVFATLARVIAGFVLGSVPGILVGIVMGLNRTVRSMLDATMSAIYVLPKIAIFPILMLVFPDPFGEGPKITVVAISAFFLVAISTMAGVQGIEPVLLQAGKNFGANRWQMFRHVILPGAMPIIFSGLRLALGTALIVIVAVEFVRAQRGVGYLIFYNWQVLSTAKMYAALIVVMLLGVLLTALLQWVERLAMPWRR